MNTDTYATYFAGITYLFVVVTLVIWLFTILISEVATVILIKLKQSSFPQNKDPSTKKTTKG